MSLDTSIQDDFDSGFDSFWNSDFSNNYNILNYSGDNSAIEISAGGGFSFGFSNGFDIDNDVYLTTPSTNIGGKLDFKVTFILGSDNTEDNIVRFNIVDFVTEQNICSLEWASGYAQIHKPFGTVQDTQSFPFNAYSGIPLRMTRDDSDLITFYYQDGFVGGEPNWVQFSYSFTDSSDVYLTVNGATKHGFSRIYLEADYGFGEDGSLDIFNPSFILKNRSVKTYNITDDIIQLKTRFILNNRTSYTENVGGTIFCNVNGVTGLQSFITDDKGVAYIDIPVTAIPSTSINTCLVWVSGVYLGNQLNSSVARLNFINN